MGLGIAQPSRRHPRGASRGHSCTPSPRALAVRGSGSRHPRGPASARSADRRLRADRPARRQLIVAGTRLNANGPREGAHRFEARSPETSSRHCSSNRWKHGPSEAARCGPSARRRHLNAGRSRDSVPARSHRANRDGMLSCLDCPAASPKSRARAESAMPPVGLSMRQSPSSTSISRRTSMLWPSAARPETQSRRTLPWPRVPSSRAVCCRS